MNLECGLLEVDARNWSVSYNHLEEVKDFLSHFRKLSRKFDVLKKERDRVAKEINLILSRDRTRSLTR